MYSVYLIYLKKRNHRNTKGVLTLRLTERCLRTFDTILLGENLEQNLSKFVVRMKHAASV